MKRLSRLLGVSIPLIIFNGCGLNIFPVSNNQGEVCFDNKGDKISCGNIISNVSAKIGSDTDTDSTLFHSKINFVLLNEYIEQMSMDLRADMKESHTVSSITVTQFSFLDPSVKSDVLTKHIAEAFIGELKRAGLPVNDSKEPLIDNESFMDFAYVLTSDELQRYQDYSYLLTGSLTKNAKGVIVNARIVGSLTGNKVIASTSKFIPNIILRQL